MRYLSYIALVSLALSACKTPSEEGHVLARVGDVVLLEADLQRKMGDEIALEDSILVQQFINNWVRQQALVQEAKQILSPSEVDKTDLLEQYYNDLLIYELEQKLVAERMDTVVSETDLLTYYNANKKNFQLRENIVRLRFFALPTQTNTKLWWLRFKKGSPKFLSKLEEMCTEAGTNFYYNDDNWLRFNDVLKEVPITTYNQESYLNNHRFVRLDEQDATYFVEILDFKVKNNTSPFDFERERIKQIILHKRKLEVLKQIETEIVRKAYNDQKIETF